MPGGILVWIDCRSRAVDPLAFAGLASALAHRGVDGSQERLLGQVALAQHNFAVSPTGALCPYEDDGLYLLLDGRLDHRRRLCDSLGLSSISSSDPRLVLAAYRRWGTRWIEHIHGSVAAVILDRPRHRVLASRDELGRVPLFYHVAGDFVLLASEPRAILGHPKVDPATDVAWLSWYFGLLGSEIRERTPFSEVKQLLPGQSLLWEEPDRLTFLEAERRLGAGRLRYRSADQYAERFRELVDASIANATAGHDRVGIMLSGGMDSCPVACRAARQFRRTGQKLTAFSWTLDRFPASNERHELSACAEFAGIDTRLLAADDLWSLEEPVAWPMDRNSPLSNPFLKLFVAIYQRAALDGCRILLQGTFADALYPNGWGLADALSDLKLVTAARELAWLTRELGIFALPRRPELRNLGKRLLQVDRLRGPQPPPWLTSRAADALHFDWWPPEAARHPRPDQYRGLLGAGVFDFQVGFGLEQTSRGIYRCDPYHDWDLVDFMLSIPAYPCHRGGQKKRIAREAMRGRMPEPLRIRPRGSLLTSFFNAGFEQSRGAIGRYLTRADCTWQEYLRPEAIRPALADRDASDREKLLAWMALTYELWMQRLDAGTSRDL